MRLNKYITQANGLSRRKADQMIQDGRVTINGKVARLAQSVSDDDKVKLDGKLLIIMPVKTTIMLNKPVGYVCSHDGQGSPTIYDLLPKKYIHLKCIGRLDKDSSGLILLTNDGDLSYHLSHPSFNISKKYQLVLSKQLSEDDAQKLLIGVKLDDGPSKFDKIINSKSGSVEVTLHGGRNRQIRRSFEALGYSVSSLHRIQFGNHKIHKLQSGQYREILKPT